MLRRRWMLITVLVGVAVAAATATMFVWPTQDRVEDADAVVMFVGGHGERLEAALALVARHGIPTLVIPNGTDLRWPEANALCADGGATEVLCPTPDPDTTRGEARLIADLAADRGWDRVVLVTSDYHLTRSRMLLGRCFGGEIVAVGAEPRLGPVAHLTRIGHEWLAVLHAVVVDRGC